MRSDMGKVVITRPRTHSHWGYKDVRNCRNMIATMLKNLKFAHANDDDMEEAVETIETGGIESMRSVYVRNHGDTKDFTDLLGPIIGYLHSKVGTHWDEVWSDVCQNLRGSHAVEHVREHVEQMVQFKDGKILFGRYRTGKDDYMYGNDFYVDDDGILQRQLQRPKKVTQYKNYGNYLRFSKEPEDRVWVIEKYCLQGKLRDGRRRYSDSFRTLTPADIAYNEKLENFKLFINDDGVEYIYLTNAWFKFIYANISDLKLNSQVSVHVKRNFGTDEEIGPRSVQYFEYDILGNQTSTSVSLNNTNRVIRHRLLQVSHSELKRIGLI